MHPFSLPALVFAIIASFSPAALFDIAHLVPPAPARVLRLSIGPAIPSDRGVTNVHLALDLLEDHQDCEPDLLHIKSSFVVTVDFHQVLRSTAISTGTDPNDKTLSGCLPPAAVSCALPSDSGPAASFFLLPALAFVLLYALSLGPDLDAALARACIKSTESSAKSNGELETAVVDVSNTVLSPAEGVNSPDIILPAEDVLSLPSLLLVNEVVPLVDPFPSVRSIYTGEEAPRLGTDRVRARTVTPPRSSSRLRTRTAPGHLVPTSASVTPASTAVRTIVPAKDVLSPLSPPRACTIRARPDRVRATTESPTTRPRCSSRVRTRTAPGQLVIAPTTPAGAAVNRILPLPPLSALAIPRPPSPAIQSTPAPPTFAHPFRPACQAQPATCGIIYQTPIAPPPRVIYATSTSSPVPASGMSRRASTIVYHGRSAPPAFSFPRESIVYFPAPHSFVRAQLQQRANALHNQGGRKTTTLTGGVMLGTAQRRAQPQISVMHGRAPGAR
ncbi:hypothetical protein B0H11DRAFT_1298449 [Mycena galericulata]|nr:hypothetical protein B0H11DRAFT_1298449 [Mycena galericulata]